METVRSLALELYYRPHLCLQSTLYLYLLTPEEVAVLEEHFGVGFCLRRGNIAKALGRIQRMVTQDSLVTFAGLGNIGLAKKLLYNKSSVGDIPDALREASRYGHLEIVELLLPRVSMNLTLGSALAEAAYSGHLPIVQRLLEAGAGSLNYALYEAGRGARLEMAEVLLQAGADDFNKGLAGAAMGGCLELVQRLLTLGATKTGKPLVYAARFAGPQALKMVELLLGLLPPAKAQLYIQRAAEAAATPAVMARLLEAGASKYQLMLMGAAQTDNLEVLKLLVDRSLIPHYYPTLVCTAAAQGHTAMVEFLLNYVSISINHILLKAAGSGNPATVRLALDRGASHLEPALIEVCSSEYFGQESRQIAEMLIRAGAANLSAALEEAAQYGNFKAVKYLVGKGATDFNIALALAIPTPQGLQIAALLLDAGADDLNGALRVLDERPTLKAFVKLLRRKNLLSSDNRELEPQLAETLRTQGLL